MRKRLTALLAATFVSLSGAAACGGSEEEQSQKELTQQEQTTEATERDERTEEAKEKQRASYYGEEFAGSPTASGEPYDPGGFTAAHPYLPLGTRLRVSHHGRSVDVTINDRSSSVLDLSLGAAQEIGLKEAGAAVVETEVLP